MENVQFTFSLNTSSDWVTWSAPSFYSDDIPQGSITTYNVCVKSQDGSVIVNINTTDTFYQLPNDLTICNFYTASITAFIEQYSSFVKNATKENTGSKIILLFSLINYYIFRSYYQCNEI